MMEAALATPMRILGRLLEARTGQILTESRSWRVEVALGPVLKAHRLPGLEALVALVAADPGGAAAMDAVHALLNNETSFFRDAAVFRMIGDELLPRLAARAADQGGRAIRVWSLGCSTGQEPYSLAMAFRNGGLREQGARLGILATDVSRKAVMRARAGAFDRAEVQRGLSAGDLVRWFEREGGCADERWRIAPAVREMVDFRIDNLFDDHVPSGPFDLILCRNVLLYFSPERRRRLFGILARHSAPGSVLLLGAGEAVLGQTDAFAASREYRGAYERVPVFEPAAEEDGHGADFGA